MAGTDEKAEEGAESPHEPEIERHETSGIEIYQRKLNPWLKVVYVLVAIWAIWYLIANWGGLGPGLAQ